MNSSVIILAVLEKGSGYGLFGKKYDVKIGFFFFRKLTQSYCFVLLNDLCLFTFTYIYKVYRSGIISSLHFGNFEVENWENMSIFDWERSGFNSCRKLD